MQVITVKVLGSDYLESSDSSIGKKHLTEEKIHLTSQDWNAVSQLWSIHISHRVRETLLHRIRYVEWHFPPQHQAKKKKELFYPQCSPRISSVKEFISILLNGVFI